MWELRDEVECSRLIGEAPITVRWVDVSKRDDVHVNYRSRLVARQIKTKGTESIFAGIPPLQAIRSVVSMAATACGSWKPVWDPMPKRRTQMLLIDITRAYFNAKTAPDKPTYVDLPREHPQYCKEVGLLSTTCTARWVPPMVGKKNIAAR